MAHSWNSNPLVRYFCFVMVGLGGVDMNNFREVLNILRLFRLHSRYYINFSYFTLFSMTVLCYSRYIVFNHITPIKVVCGVY